MDDFIYLDNAATTFPKPEAVYSEMDRVNRSLCVNAGRGSYKLAREATQIIDETKKALLRLVKAKGNEKVVFSPSITIAINQILNGIEFKCGDVVYISDFEHNAVARTMYKLQKKKGIIVKRLPVDADLKIDIEKTKNLFAIDKPKCVCCIHVSNVTGYILPVKEIFEVAKRVNAVTILDTAQSLGIVPFDINPNYDFVAFAGHKSLYGPLGIGGFIDNSDVTLSTVLTGGTGSDSLNVEMANDSPRRYETSSPNIVAIAGLNKALEELDVDKNFEYELNLTRYTVNKLNKIDDIVLYLPKEQTEHISIVSFNVKGYKAAEVGEILDAEHNIAVRTGYHCAPYIHKLLADEPYAGTVRVGMGRYNTCEEIDALYEALVEL